MQYRIINLKSNTRFLDSYVRLRNTYVEELCTNKVSVEQTKVWLREKQVEVFCLIDPEELVGVVILYKYKDNELTIFVKETSKGLGSLLLEYIESFAKKNNFTHLWAWTKKNNIPAQKLFLKNGFLKDQDVKIIYEEKAIEGIKFIKQLQ